MHAVDNNKDLGSSSNSIEPLIAGRPMKIYSNGIDTKVSPKKCYVVLSLLFLLTVFGHVLFTTPGMGRRECELT
jgi:hypothetical protein